MAFVVEDGTGLDTATSYVTVEFADAYIEGFMPSYFSDWDVLTLEQKQFKLQIASSYFDTLLKWRSDLYLTTQGLSFPREEFIDSDGRTISGIPAIVMESVVRITAESLDKDLYAPKTYLESDKYGDAMQVFTKPKEDSSGIVSDVIRILLNRGFGVSQSSVVEIYRA